MEVSLFIVTKNRPKELSVTLDKLFPLLDLNCQEVLVLIDGCPETMKLKHLYPWVKWDSVPISVGASPARNILYKKGLGTIFIGLDDDAHPISPNFIAHIQAVFAASSTIGVVAIQEVKGIFLSDAVALAAASSINEAFFTNDFIGCGFAIKKEVYEQTNGFPVWIDIYGEEACVAIEVLDLGFQIKYVSAIMVNHRVDRLARIEQGRFYYRFAKQLKNTIFYDLVYIRNPSFKIAKLVFHNLKKYGFQDWTYFKLFWKSFFQALLSFKYVMRFRKPVQKSTLDRARKLRGLQY